ncbi:hypothetical protein [Saccharomonospora piscinae]|uniref:hypothetical protein n=1 Tax=Saccharomonospora piscinae TaxID=687388 RepID=UPI0009DCE8BB|nr:hypothetical protein [Saccharomonospora piscinae]
MEHKRRCRELIESTAAFQTSFLKRAITAKKAAAKIAKTTTTKRPRARYGLGPDAAFTLSM